jgi:hypothetical protein
MAAKGGSNYRVAANPDRARQEFPAEGNFNNKTLWIVFSSAGATTPMS